jgi:ChrR Cupin-like domain
VKITPGIVYEENILWSRLNVDDTEGHAWFKILAKDPDTGATTALVRYEAGYKAPKAESEVYSDNLFLSGGLTDGTRSFGKYTYLYRPSGTSYGPIKVREDTTKFVITGGKGEKSSGKSLFVQNIDTGPWDPAPYKGPGHPGMSRTLRVDKKANCSIGWRVNPRPWQSYPNKTVVHEFVEEVFVVEGENVDYYGDIESWVYWRPGMYMHRPPYRARHGHTFKYKVPFKVFVKHHSTHPSEPHDAVEGIPAPTLAQ